MAAESSTKSSASSFGGVCWAIDQDKTLAGSAISYIASGNTIPIRGSDRVIQNHVVITPAGEGNPSGGEFAKRLLDVGVDCGLAGMAYASTAASCGGTVVTLGTAAPLCVLSVAGATTSTWSCATSIGKFVNEIQDPNFNKMIEQDGHWYKTVNDYIGYAGKVFDVLSLGASFKQLKALRTVTKQHAGKVGQAYNHKQSVQATKEIADATYEALTFDALLKEINRKGANLRVSPKTVTEAMETVIEKGLSNQATKRMINQRGLPKPFSPAEQLKSNVKDIRNAAMSLGADKAKDGGKAVMDEAAKRDAERPKQKHVMHVFQQAKP